MALDLRNSDGSRRKPTGWIVISGPSTRTKEFGLCIARPTTATLWVPETPSTRGDLQVLSQPRAPRR
jgi:hypothetical protein